MDIKVNIALSAAPRERLRELQDLRDAVNREIDETVDALLYDLPIDFKDSPYDADGNFDERYFDRQQVGGAPPYRCTRARPGVVAACRHADCKPPRRQEHPAAPYVATYEPKFGPPATDIIEGPNGPIAPR